jgi:hypothetical protein
LRFDSIWLFDHLHTVPKPTDELTFESFTSLSALRQLAELGVDRVMGLLQASATSDDALVALADDARTAGRPLETEGPAM